LRDRERCALVAPVLRVRAFIFGTRLPEEEPPRTEHVEAIRGRVAVAEGSAPHERKSPDRALMGLGIRLVAPAMGAGDVEEARGSAPLCNHCSKRTAHEKHIWPRPPPAKRKILQVLPNERGYLGSRKRGNHVRSRFAESPQFRQEFGLLPES